MSTRLWPEQFHKHVSVRRFDPLVVLFFRFHNFKSEFLVEIYGALVIYLNVSNTKSQIVRKMIRNLPMIIHLQKYAMEIAIFFNKVQDMF